MIDKIKSIFKNKDKHITIGVVFIMLLISIFTLIKLDVTKNIFKLKADAITLQENEAMFLSGREVNSKMKLLAGDENANNTTINESIKSIKKSAILSINPTNDNIVSVFHSPKPIYMWYDNGTIYWYSEAVTIYFYSDSGSFFAHLEQLETIPELNQFNTKAVEKMTGMFYDCKKIVSLNLTNFDTANVVYMSDMFRDCESLKEIDLSSFDMSSTSYFYSLFRNTPSLQKIKTPKVYFNDSNQELELEKLMIDEQNNKYKVLKNTSLTNTWIYVPTTFASGSEVNKKIRILSGDENSHSALILDNISITKIKRSEVLSIIPTEDNIISSLDSIKPIYAWYDNGTIYWYSEEQKPYLNLNSDCMFEKLKNLEEIPELNQFDTSNVENMSYMFSGCNSLVSLNLSSFDTTNVIDMKGMFASCKSLTTLDLSSFNTSNVIDMHDMFNGSSNLVSINLSTFDTRNVFFMNGMFYDCQNITTLDLSSFDTSNVANMYMTFYNCTNLKTIYVSAHETFDTTKVGESTYMFWKCNSLKGMNNTSYDENYKDKTYARIDKNGTPGYFSVKVVAIPTCPNKTYNTTEQTLLEAHTTGDYINSILKGTNAGNYNTSLTLTGNYQWSDGSTNTTRILTCKINPYDMSNAIIASTSDQIYSGNEIKPEPSITALSKTLIKDTDYTLSYTNNINTGRATITVTGKGNYTGTKISTFNITEVDLSNLDIKDDLYVILSKFNTKSTIEDMIKTNVTIIHNDEELSDTESLTTGDILKIGSLSYSIVILGDPNKDGSVDGADISRIYKIYRGITTATTLENYAADANKDGYVDGADISRTYKIYRGLYQD